MSRVRLAAGLTAGRAASAAEYYVAPTGNDSNPGTMDAPFATLQRGHDVAAAGDTVWIRGGTYRPTTGKTSKAGFVISKSGTSDTNRIKFWAYPGELPVFDFSQLQLGDVDDGRLLRDRQLAALQGLEVTNVPMPGGASNNGIWNVGQQQQPRRQQHLREPQHPPHHRAGLSIAHNGNGVGGGHLILNCDSHDNYDPNSQPGRRAERRRLRRTTTRRAGRLRSIRGCRAWWNSDDGYDLINQEVPVIIENCGRWATATSIGTTRPPSGNGNGFKMGSSQTGIRHMVRNSLAWKNVASGFYANHSSGGNDWYNNTSYMNGTQYNMLASPTRRLDDDHHPDGRKVHKMRNNIGFPNKNTNMDGRRHDVQHVGPEHHARQRRLRQRSSDANGSSVGPAQGGRQPARRQLHAPGREQPDDQQGNGRRPAVRRQRARSRRVRVRRGPTAGTGGASGTAGHRRRHGGRGGARAARGGGAAGRGRRERRGGAGRGGNGGATGRGGRGGTAGGTGGAGATGTGGASAGTGGRRRRAPAARRS